MRTMLLLAALNLLAGPNARAASPVVIVLLGKGVQIYGCAPGEAGYAWRLKAPDAVLTDAAGDKVGHHYGGPTWQADDGSVVMGEPVVASRSPETGAIPWLVLRAKAHSGQGLLSGVSYVVRSDTEGGAAPATGCDAGHSGAEARVGYSATYTFFPGDAGRLTTRAERP